MKEIRTRFFAIALTLLFFSSFPTSGQSGTLYRCVNSKGSVMITDNVPTDPDFKCTFGASYKDLTPQERAQQQREVEAERQRMNAAVRRQEAEPHRVNQTSSSQGSSESARQAEITRKESELRSVVGRMRPGDSLDTVQRNALEAAAIKGEINRLQRQDPNYRPDPNAKVNRRIDDLEFELQQERMNRKFDNLMRR